MKVEYRFGEKVRRTRTERAWSQEQLAEVAGVATRTVQRVEANRTQDGDTLRAIAAAFNADVRDLRSKYWIAESKPLRALLIESAEDFRVAIQRAYHYYSYRRLGTLKPEIEPRVDELMEEIFSDIWAMGPDEPEFSSFIKDIREPLEELQRMGLTFFSIQETRDVFIKGGNPGEKIPWEDMTTCHFILVPRYGCFHLGGRGSTEQLHLFSSQCDSASKTLLRILKEEREMGLFVTALHAVVCAGGEASVYWCEVCFPLLEDGSRISMSYIQQVTGFHRKSGLHLVRNH